MERLSNNANMGSGSLSLREFAIERERHNMERLDSILLLAEGLEKLNQLVKHAPKENGIYTDTNLTKAGLSKSLIGVLERRKILERKLAKALEMYSGYKVEFDNDEDLETFNREILINPKVVSDYLIPYDRVQSVARYRLHLETLARHTENSRREVDFAIYRLRRFE